MWYSRKWQSELLERYIFLAGEKNFAILLAIGYYRVPFKNFLDIGLIGFVLKQKHMGMQTDRSQSFVKRTSFGKN